MSRARLLAIGALIAVSFAVRHLGQLDPGLRPLSLAGIRGLLLYEAGHYLPAAAAYREDLRLQFEAGGVALDDAELTYYGGDQTRARLLAERELDEDPQAIAALLTLGELELDRGRPAAAAELFESARAAAPEDRDAHLLAAVAHARAGNDGTAIARFNEGLREPGIEQRPTTLLQALAATGELTDREPVPACVLAHLHRYLRVFDDAHAGPALDHAREAIRRQDHADAAQLTIGIVESKRVADDAALAAFLAAIELNPRNAEAYRWAAVTYEHRGDLVREIEMRRGAYASAPDDPFYAVTLARVLSDKLGRHREALALDRKVLARGWKTPALLNHLGYLHGELGDAETSLRFYRRASRLAPRDPWHVVGIGAALDALGRYDEAIAAFQDAAELNPRWVEPRRRLAVAYRTAGRFDDAIVQFEDVFRLDPTLRTYQIDLCFLYHLAGRFDDARRCASNLTFRIYEKSDATFLATFSLRDVLRGSP